MKSILELFAQDEIKVDTRDFNYTTEYLDKCKKMQILEQKIINKLDEEGKALLDEYAGKGRIKKNRKGLWDNREIVKVDHIVGIDYNTGEETDWIKIHHSKRRTHIVPFKKQMNGDDEDA